VPLTSGARPTTTPTDNRANHPLLQLLAREWRLPRRDLVLAGSGKSRSKTVQISADSTVLPERLGPLLATSPRR